MEPAPTRSALEVAEGTDTVAAVPFEGESGWQRPSYRLRSLRRAQAILGATAVAVVGGLVGAATAPGWVALLVVLAALVSIPVAWAYLGRRFASWGYLERDQDLLVRRGVMFLRLSVVPYGRMQTVEVAAGPAERLLGLATVHLHTASAATDARIPGLAGPDASGLRDRLARLGEANAEGL